MSGGGSLLESVQGLLERTYRMSPLSGIARFVVGDVGYRRFYGGVDALAGPASAAHGARVLVRETGDGVRASLYLPDDLVRALEASPPQRGLNDSNVDAFATLVEETDHLLCIAERTAERREVSCFELELHADVSKYLVLSRFLSPRRDRVGERRKIWLKWHLFEKARFDDEDPVVRRRYHDASRWAMRLLRALERRRAAERVELLRRFHAASASAKLELIARVKG